MNSKIEIDNKKCIYCGYCIEVCGSATLEIIDNKIIQTKPQLCALCGHCAAVCPESAISSNKNNKKAYKIEKTENNLNEIEKLLKNKRSIRIFKNKKIDKKNLEKIIYYAEKSPSSSNKRKREYIVITDRNKILDLEKTVIKKFNSLKKIANPVLINFIKIFSKKTAKTLNNLREDVNQMNKQFKDKNYPIFRNAHCVVIITAPTKEVQTKDDCIIAQQYMMLYAESKGLGSCIIGYAQYAHKSLEKILKIKKNQSIFAVTTLGYPKYNYNKEIIYNKKPEVNWID